MHFNSWTIVSKETGIGALETSNKKLIERVNREKYDVVPTHEYLTRVNQEIAAGSTKYNSR